jgi:orotate phosphoribosyltransferase
LNLAKEIAKSGIKYYFVRTMMDEAFRGERSKLCKEIGQNLTDEQQETLKERIRNDKSLTAEQRAALNKFVEEQQKKAEAKVTDCFVVFHYGIFPQSIEMLAAAGVKLHALATWWDALEAAEKHKYFDEMGLTETRAFLEAPEKWSASHGGRPPSRALGR